MRGGSAEVPAFTSDRLLLLGPLITPEIVALARGRVATGESFFYRDELREGLSAAAVKMALLVALEMNPREGLDNNEQGLLRGMSRKTYAARLEAGELAP